MLLNENSKNHLMIMILQKLVKFHKLMMELYQLKMKDKEFQLKIKTEMPKSIKSLNIQKQNHSV